MEVKEKESQGRGMEEAEVVCRRVGQEWIEEVADMYLEEEGLKGGT